MEGKMFRLTQYGEIFAKTNDRARALKTAKLAAKANSGTVVIEEYIVTASVQPNGYVKTASSDWDEFVD